MSNSSVPDTPAYGHAVMLRTELPHASRVVKPAFGEDFEHLLDVGQLHEVKLQVLPRGDVPEPARIALGHVGQRVNLRDVHQTLRDLDANHLHVRLPLPVGAAQQAERAPLIRAELAALERFELGDELVNLRRIRKRESARVQTSWGRPLLP